ncbi:IucA/IucC family protein [Halocatena pleomorpha]|uniref:IucA/IucC family siderophore biosynthesis protein n=1 Tax=Halocatena pleomorpha TaxID=1785090 RepID=A0A3P3RJS7_9EURY|nr:IucA/IucC family siderophore biosynthesis protein [Halocatena pleomorpha]RRJ33090.1 IucA/IucC family siderophore biosynthesis protein [Halocatena pleomorpha]
METPEHTFDSEVWTTVNRQLLRKMLSEFMYEELIEPEPIESIETDPERTRYRLSLETGVEYRFDAQARLFDSYRVLPDSVYRRDDGNWIQPNDAVRLLVDAQTHVGISDRTLGYLIREYNNTLLADAHLAARTAARDDSELIVDMEYAAIEGEMTGHPWFTYNKGRVGFSYDEYLDYAPEMKQPQTLSWIAARRDRATFSALDAIDHESLLREELGDRYTVFVDRLVGQGLDPANYYLLPVHDWQWSHSIVPFFAGEIATDAIVSVGEGPDEYLPQQSIRTLTNVDVPEKHHVKLPLRILNTNVYRGILSEQARAAPKVTAFVKEVRDRDRFLREECELLLPGEIASVHYDHPTLSELDAAPYQFHELLGCVWRESVEGMLEPSERPVTLAALLHEDTDGTPVLTEFVERSPLSLRAWLDELFKVLLFPLCHYLYRYGTVFMPHGTNVVLVLENGVPSRIALTDFVDEVAITDRELTELDEILDSDLRTDDRYKHHILHQLPPEDLCQHIFGTLFICVFRYVSDLLERAEGYNEQQFWTQVRAAIETYHARFPQHQARFETFDLFKPEFTKLCLNRNRILDHGYDDYTTRPKVTGHGTVSNALHTVAENENG